MESSAPLLFRLLTALLSTIQSPPPTSPHPLHRPTPTFSVADYGAVGDGVHYDTRHIQAAIDACASAGGGRVRFPSGRNYLTATIHLRSGVVLEIEKGARVVGGTRQGDYPAESRRWYVVLAEDAADVGITGGGEIDGQGMRFVERLDERKNVMVSWNATGDCVGDECRPRLVGFIGCRNVRVWDVKLTQPAYWWCVIHSHPLLSQQLSRIPKSHWAYDSSMQL